MTRKWFILFISILSIIIFISQICADQPNTIRIYVFMSPECSHCEPVHEENIRSIAEKCGCKVDIKYFNIEDMANYKKLCDLEKKYGSSSDEMPVVFIGNDVFGSEKGAAEKMEPTIAKYAVTGTLWPDEVVFDSKNPVVQSNGQAPQNESSSATISFDKTEGDLGELRAGQVINAVFPFKNTGTGELNIRDLRTACGCFEIKTGERKLGPGESSKVEVTFMTEGLKGPFSKSVMVDSNDETNPTIRLIIKATITQVVNISPERLNFGDMESGSVRDEEIIITPVEPKGFVVKSVKPEGNHISVTKIEKIKGNKGSYRIRIQLKAGDKPGRVYEKLSITIDSSGKLTLPFLIYGNVE